MADEIGRPARDESSESQFHYIELVPDGDIRRILDDQRQEMLGFLATIPETRAEHRYAPDKWSVAEVVSHMNDCERLYTMRAFWFARAMEFPLPSFHSDFAVKTARAADRVWSSHVHEFASIRSSTIDLFDYLPAEAWQRRGIAGDKSVSVRALAYMTAGHILHHRRVLEERYLAQ